MAGTSDEGFKFLSNVFEILNSEGVLLPNPKGPVAEYKDPADLMKIIDFSLENESGLSYEAVEKLARLVVKYSPKTNHPHFHSVLYAGYDFYGLGAAWMIDALNTIPCTYEISPVFNLAEESLIQKLLSLFGLGDGEGIFCPGGSITALYAMAAAKHRILPHGKKTGLFNQKPIVAFTSNGGHYSIAKGVNWMGIGLDNLVEVDTDTMGRMIPEKLAESLERVTKEGRVPFFVNATSGTTVLGAFDNLEKIAEVCEKYKVWLHADACYGGQVVFSKKHRYLMEGSNRFDSIGFCPQKMAGAPLQCAVYLTKHKNLFDCNCTDAVYLFQQNKFYDAQYDTGDKSIQCGRKVDGFKYWLMLKARGFEAAEESLNNIFHCAEYLRNLVRNNPGFRLVVDNKETATVCFYYIPKRLRGKTEDIEFWREINTVTLKIWENVIKEGLIMLGYSKAETINPANFLRIAIVGFPRQSEENMNDIVAFIERVGEQL